MFIYSFARAGKDYLLFFILVQLFYSFTRKSVSSFSWHTAKLYLTSRDKTSHHSHGTTSSRQVDPLKCGTIHQSSHAGSSLSQRPLFPLHTTWSTTDLGSENAGFKSKTSTAVNQHHHPSNTSTATLALHEDFSEGQMITIWQLIQDTAQQSRQEKRPRLPWTLFKPKLHQTINGHLGWSCLTQRAPRTPRKSASSCLSRTSRTVHRRNTEWWVLWFHKVTT